MSKNLVCRGSSSTFDTWYPGVCSLLISEDIKRSTLEMCKKANIVLATFSSCNPHIKTILFNSHCLSLYGAALWNITYKQLNSLEVAFNNILRRIWKLPRRCHTRILHKVSHMESLFNRTLLLSDRFTTRNCRSKSNFIRESFMRSKSMIFTPTDINTLCERKQYIKEYSNEDLMCAVYIRYLRLYCERDMDFDVESVIHTVCCD